MDAPIAIRAGLVDSLRAMWGQMSHAERSVFGIIVLLPLWWGIGFGYISLLLLAGLAASELWQFGRIRLKAPRPEVWALFAFGAYVTVNMNLHVEKITGNSLLSPTLLWIGGALVLWYIQSNDVRVRVQVAIWAIAVLMAEVLAVWLVAHFVIGESSLPIMRSLTGLLLSKQERYVEGLGDTNYLRLFDAEDGTSFLGTPRYAAFFGHPEFFAQATAFVFLLGLSGRSPWPLLLGSAAVVALILDGARSSVAVLIAVLALRMLLTLGKHGGIWALFALIAALSFGALALPPVTEALVTTYERTVDSTNNLRKASTEARSLLYGRTFESLGDAPIFGHGIPGRTVVPGYEPAKVGSHSFLLGALLYCNGLAGTLLFGIFAVTFMRWLWRTRADRPDCVWWTLLLFMILASVVAFDFTRMAILLLCTMLSLDRGRTETDEAMWAVKQFPRTQQKLAASR